MKNFLAIYIGTDAALAKAKWDELSDAERKANEEAGMKAWMEWALGMPHRSLPTVRRSERRSALPPTVSPTSKTR